MDQDLLKFDRIQKEVWIDKLENNYKHLELFF